MRRGWLLLAVVGLTACVSSPPSGRFFESGPLALPQPSRAVLLAAGDRADDARAVAFSTLVPASLAPAFAGAALDELQAAVLHLSRHEQRIERRLDSRTLAHWSAEAGVAEGVLALSGWSRLDDPGSPGAWSRFLEQWEFRIAWRGGWRVVQEAEVPPGAWWQ